MGARRGGAGGGGGGIAFWCADIANAYVPLRRHQRLFDAQAGWPGEKLHDAEQSSEPVVCMPLMECTVRTDEWFDPNFLHAFRSGDEAWKAHVTEHLPGAVFSCKMFSDEFCEMLIEEVSTT